MTEMTNKFTAYNDRYACQERPVYAQQLFKCFPHDVVLQQILGFGNAFNWMGDMPNNEYRWWYEEDYPTDSIVTGDVTIGAGTGFNCYNHPVYDPIVIPVEHPEYFNPCNVIKICAPDGTPICDSTGDQPGVTVAGPGQREMFLWVIDRDCTNGTITAYPGWGGTPIYQITAETKACILYSVAPECPEHVNSYISGLTESKNYWQLFKDGWSDTKASDRKDYYWGNSADAKGRFRQQLMGGNGHTGKLPKMLENAILYGVPLPGSQEGNSAFGGINSFGIPNYCLDSLSYYDFRHIIKDLMNAGADVTPQNYMMLVSPDVQLMIDDWAQCRVCNDLPSNMNYGFGVKTITTSFGDLATTVHRRLQKNEIYILDTSKMDLFIRDDWQEHALPNPDTTRCTNYEIYGEFGFALACPCHHAKITVNQECLDGCCETHGCQPGQGCLPSFCDPLVPISEDMIVDPIVIG